MENDLSTLVKDHADRLADFRGACERRQQQMAQLRRQHHPDLIALAQLTRENDAACAGFRQAAADFRKRLKELLLASSLCSLPSTERERIHGLLKAIDHA